jgi:hypothetical protein
VKFVDFKGFYTLGLVLLQRRDIPRTKKNKYRPLRVLSNTVSLLSLYLSLSHLSLSPFHDAKRL